MHGDYCIDTEEFFGSERKQLTSNQKFRPPLQIRKTVCIHTPIEISIDKIIWGSQ